MPPTVQRMGKSLKNELARGFTLPDTALPGYPPSPTGVYLPRSSVWGEPEEGAGAGVYSPGYGPPRVSPSGRGYLPRSSVWGEPEERAGAGVSSPGYGPPRVSPLGAGIPPTVQRMGKSLKNELARGFTLPDTAFLGYRHDCPRPSPSGVGDAGILRAGCRHTETRDRGGGFLPPPRLPLPAWGYLPRSSYGEEPEEGASAGVSSPGYGPPRVSPSGRGRRRGEPGGVGDGAYSSSPSASGTRAPMYTSSKNASCQRASLPSSIKKRSGM